MTQKARSAAQGLASLGRYGDTTLVHMSKKEVAGLQNLARAHGTSLTVNPATGMPEAFNLDSLLPTLGGLAVGIMAPWALPYVAAGTAGAMKASGKDWGESLLTGLQVYGGGSLGAGIGSAGAATAPTTELASQTAGQAAAAGSAGAGTAAGTAAETAAQTAAQTAGTAGQAAAATPEMVTAPLEGANAVSGAPLQTMPMETPVADTFANAPPSGFGYDEGIDQATGQLTSDTTSRLANLPGAPQATTTPFDTTQALTKDQLAAGRADYFNQAGTMGDRASDFGRGVKGLFDPSNKSVTFGNTFGAMNTPAQIGVGTGIAGGFVEEPKDTTPEKQKPVYYIRDPKTGKPLYSQGTVNPNVAKLGYVPQGENYFQGAGFNPGVYSYSYDKYEPVPGMRSGGSVGIRHLLGGGQLSQDAAKNVIANSGTAPQPAQPSPNQMAMQSANQYFQNQAANAPSGPMMQAAPSSQAMNDYLAQGNQMITPVGRPVNAQGLEGEGTDTRLANLQTAANKYDFEQKLKTADDAFLAPLANKGRKLAGEAYIDENGNVQYQGNQDKYWSADAPAIMGSSDAIQLYRSKNPSMSTTPIKSGGYKNNNMASGGVTGSDRPRTIDKPMGALQPLVDRYNAAADAGYFDRGNGGIFGIIRGQNANNEDPYRNSNNESQHYAMGGTTYAAGGKLLRGPGDGMSDSIPAVIGGHKPQRAALADGEFVVPADVVSHLGNGSTEAGSRKLYAMMDKIRHARTGRKKQAPRINPDRFMPR